jgi:uncharacterized membrane protein (DUF106 family)
MFQILFDVLLTLSNIPYSTFFIFGLAALISLLATLVTRHFTDPNSKAWRKEVSDWNRALLGARKNKDQKTLDNLMKKQHYIMQVQMKMMWQSLKVSLLFLIPLLIIWSLLSGFYTYAGNPIAVAYFPGIGSIIKLPLLNLTITSLFWWYLLCSLFFGIVFQHLFGLTETNE